MSIIIFVLPTSGKKEESIEVLQHTRLHVLSHSCHNEGQPRSQGSLLPVSRSVGLVGENPGNEVEGGLLARTQIRELL